MAVSEQPSRMRYIAETYRTGQGLVSLCRPCSHNLGIRDLRGANHGKCERRRQRVSRRESHPDTL